MLRRRRITTLADLELQAHAVAVLIDTRSNPCPAGCAPGRLRGTILRIHGPFLFGTTEKLAEATKDLNQFGEGRRPDRRRGRGHGARRAALYLPHRGDGHVGGNLPLG
jgi:hypothetical protein